MYIIVVIFSLNWPLLLLRPWKTAPRLIRTLASVHSLSTSLAAVIGGIVSQNGIYLQGSKIRAAGLALDILRDLDGVNTAASVNVGFAKLSDPGQVFVG